MRRRAGACIAIRSLLCVTACFRVGHAFAVGQADAARQHLLGVAMAHVVALLYDNGSRNARARALDACSSVEGGGPAGDLPVLDLVHAVLHLTAPPPPSPTNRLDLSGVATAAASAASACGFGSLPVAEGEKLMAGVVLGERVMVQGGLGSFVTAMQLQRLQHQRSSTFAVIRAFYPLAPPAVFDGRRLHIAFASKDFGFSSVGQLVWHVTHDANAHPHTWPHRSTEHWPRSRCAAACLCCPSARAMTPRSSSSCRRASIGLWT
jgi:hypothetical protein